MTPSRALMLALFLALWAGMALAMIFGGSQP